jgi:1-acyl-sn-glycerol-3-phosphate acyltransferase
MSRTRPTSIRNHVRSVCFAYFAFTWTAACFIVGLLALLLAPRSGRLSYYVFRLWGWGFLFGFGAGVRVENAERVDPRRPHLIVANHASWLDPPVLLAVGALRLRFVLKRELLAVPFVGVYARLAGHYLLDRKDPRAAKQLMQVAVERAHLYGHSPLVFPEGTRTQDGRLGELRSGSFQLAIDGDMPIQPIAILGSWEMMPRGASAPRRAGEIILRIGEPIPVEGMTGSRGRRELTARVEAALHDLGVS